MRPDLAGAAAGAGLLCFMLEHCEHDDIICESSGNRWDHYCINTRLLDG